MWPSLTDPERALWHSGRGLPLIVAIHGSSHVCGDPLRSPTIPGAPLLAPTPCHASHFPLLPMPSHSKFFGPHRASCAEAGVLGRGLALELPAAQVCREGDGRVSTNVMLRDLDVVQEWMAEDWRLLWMMCSISQTSNSHIDIIMKSPLHRDGRVTRGGAASTPGNALRRVRRRIEQTYPELHGVSGKVTSCDACC